MTITFLIISFSWIFFRAESISHALDYIRRIASINAYNNWAGSSISSKKFLEVIEILPILLFFFIIIEWAQREKQHALYFSSNTSVSKVVRRCLYVISSVLIFGFWFYNKQEFIYFAF